jgi:type I phosphodiesterase/nucleotide pyrophosphatase
MMIAIRRLAAMCAVVLCAAIAPPSAATHAQGAAPGAPKLVVVLIADQMRADYLERGAPAMTGGLARIRERGAVFTQAAYPYLNTITCAGHATISTGSFPYRHGMILNEWIDRTAGVVRGCTADAGTRIVSYDSVTGEGDSIKNMLVPTLSDQIRERAKGRVVALSMKPRSAITLAGRKADAAVWFNEDNLGAWETSTAYTKTPVPFIKDFVAANPILADQNKVWSLTLSADKYQNADEAVGERPQTGWTKTFPHPIAGDGKVDKNFYLRWRASPFADEYLARMGMHAIDALQLGRGAGTDFLGISFSALDSVGHAFGPNSFEVQDMVLRLDLTIGRLLEHLDRTVGAGNYVVAFGSDHGVAVIPDQVPGAGRQLGSAVLAAINTALEPIWGPGKYAVISAYTDIYLAAGVVDRLEAEPRAQKAVFAALLAQPGLARVFMADEVDGSGARESDDPVRRAAALSHYRPRSGDIIVVPKEGWILSSSATTHGTMYTYDARVPVMFFGAGIKAGRYDTAATPADIAPTLAAVARVRLDRVDGKVLSDALAVPTATSSGRVE